MATPECFITDNGIRTIVSQDTSLRHQALVVCVDISQTADSDLNYPHFLEHVLMRDRSQFGDQSLSQLVDASANKSSAATFPSLLAFELDCVPSSVPHLFPALLETLALPKIDEFAVETERTVIASEMVERVASPDAGVWERAWDNHDFVHTSVREAATLDSVTVDGLVAFHRQLFKSANMFVVTAGPSPAADIANIIANSAIEPSETASEGIGTRPWQDHRQTVVAGGETKMTGHYLRVINVPQPEAVSRVFAALNRRECEGSFFTTAVDDIGVYSAHLMPVKYPFVDDARHYVATEGTIAQVKKVHDLGTTTVHDFAETPPAIAELEHVKQIIRNESVFGDNDPTFCHNRPGEVVSGLVEQLPHFPNILSEEARLRNVDEVTPDQVQQLSRDLLGAPVSFSVAGPKRYVDAISSHVS